MGEFIFNVFLLLFSSAMFVASFSIPIWDGDIITRLWPQIFLVIMMVLFTIKTVGIWHKLPKNQPKISIKKIFEQGNPGTRRLLLTFAVLVVYIFSLQYGGFFLMTTLFTAFISLMLGAKPIKALIVGVCITGIIYAIFVWGLGIRPPRGIGFIYDFSLWLENLL